MNRTAAAASRRSFLSIWGHRAVVLATVLNVGCAAFSPAPRTAAPSPVPIPPIPQPEVRQRPIDSSPAPAEAPFTVESPSQPFRPELSPPETTTGGPAPPSAEPPRAAESLSGPRIIPQQIFVPARLQLSIKAPERKQTGSGATYVLTVRNMGDVAVDDVVVTCAFDDALVFSGRSEHKVRQTLGRVAPGEHKELPLSLMADTPGRHCCRFEAIAEGLEPVTAEACVEFVPRQLAVSLRGPGERTIGDRAEFTLLIENQSDRPIEGLRVRLFHDGALSAGEVSAPADARRGSFGWSIPQLAPGERTHLRAEFVCSHLSEQSCLVAEVRAIDVPDDEVEACLAIRPVTLPLAVQIEDSADAVRLSSAMEYRVTVRNGGFETVRNVALTADVPYQFRVTDVEVRIGDRLMESSAEAAGQTVEVSPVAELRPEEVLTYRIRVKAIEAGVGEFTARLTRAGRVESVSVTEITTVIP